jgi:hypothetical protein
LFRAHRPPETEAAAGILAALDGQRDIVERRQAEEDIGDLVGTRHPGADPTVHRQLGDVVPGKVNAAAVGLQGTRYVMNEGRLASAVRADQGMHLAGIDAEIHVLERVDRSKAP